MNKWKLLPRMAVKGVIQNGTVYYPYLMAGIFSVSTFFVFSSILYNDLIKTLPRSAYAWVMLSIGRVLLGIILIPFLYYANSFLIKRRTREFGLYSILGLEKRHIGLMLLSETLMVYLIVTAGGIILGSVLSKLLFLLLLKLSGLPVDVRFVFTWQAFKDTILFFSVVFLINLFCGLIQIGKSKPVELLSGSKKGEKQPRWLRLYGVSGIVVLGVGYAVSITSELDSMIFMDFFLAVFLVVIGTYLLFTSGSVLLLKLLKKNKRFYYKSENFVTVSGMIYRMKKNAASLANICIFSTMVIITLVCTFTLYLGLNGITHFAHPYDISGDFGSGDISIDKAEGKVKELSEKYEIEAERVDVFDFMRFNCSLNGNQFIREQSEAGFENRYSVYLMTLEDYNRLESENKTLNDKQILFYSSGENFGFEQVEFMGVSFEVKEELENMFPFPKAGKSNFGTEFVIVVKDKTAQDKCAKAFGKINGVTDMDAFLESGYQRVGVVLEGKDEFKQGFVEELSDWMQEQDGFTAWSNGLNERADIKSMYGGLLFIGIIFGIIFFMCLLLVMYYKQISEGYEDQVSFAIMQKVGMSDKEIKSTIHRQILLVFFLPLAGALMHTAAGMFMVNNLMATLGLFDNRLMAGCTLMVALIFVIIYGFSYLMTAKTYYRIVS